MKNKQPLKKGYGLWIFGAILLLISLGCYVPVSLGLAKGYLLAAGQVGGLAAGAVYLLFFKNRRQEQAAPVSPNRRSRRASAKEPSDDLRAILKNALSASVDVSCWVCFFILLTFPIQNLLSGGGLVSLNECAHYQNLWEMIVYVWILPSVCLEVLHRAVVLPLLEERFEKRWQVLLFSGLFYLFSSPQIGTMLARFALGVLLCLLFLRTRSLLVCFCSALAAQGIFFLAGYLQVLGIAGAESYTFLQCLGMGLTFAAPGAVILYFNEKIKKKRRVPLLEVILLLGAAALAFVLGMCMWLQQ